jgi:iron-sulfur cluster assembly accessory protein
MPRGIGVPARKERCVSVELSEAAAAEIRGILRQQGLDDQQTYLRVGVSGTGSNRNFSLDLTEERTGDDLLLESRGIAILVDREAQPRLEGMKIDFREIGSARGFTFHAPPERSRGRQGAHDPAEPMPDEQQVRAMLKSVIDPEVGLNIIDLGLVYEVLIEQRIVRVKMTMTTPACPMSEQIRADVISQVSGNYPGVAEVEVNVVWEPRWSNAMISDEGKKKLGWSL